MSPPTSAQRPRSMSAVAYSATTCSDTPDTLRRGCSRGGGWHVVNAGPRGQRLESQLYNVKQSWQHAYQGEAICWVLLCCAGVAQGRVHPSTGQRSIPMLTARPRARPRSSAPRPAARPGPPAPAAGARQTRTRARLQRHGSRGGGTDVGISHGPRMVCTWGELGQARGCSSRVQEGTQGPDKAGGATKAVARLQHTRTRWGQARCVLLLRAHCACGCTPIA